MSKFTGNIIRLPAVTPTQNSASGVYTLDDQFTAQSSGTWPIVRDQYFNYTTLLLTGAVQGTAYPNPVTQPYSFLSDASTNNFVVSPNGDVSARPFNPYLNSYSNYFGGSSDFLRASVSAISSSSFTVEAWVYFAGASTTNATIYDFANATNGYGMYLVHTSPGNLTAQFYSNNTGTLIGQISTNFAGNYNKWVHVAVSYDGSTYRLFVGGFLVGTPVSSATQVVAINTLTVGARSDSSPTQVWLGYISNFRYVTGSALYTTNFTPSISPLGIAGTGTTRLLTCQSNRFIDNSSSPLTLTVTGTPAVSQNSPFVSYDTTNGSGYFDGTGDYLSVADNTALDMEASDFTMECWVYLSETPSSADGIFAKRTDIGTFGGVLIFFNGLTPNFYATLNGSSWGIAFSSSISATLNAWTHLAFTRSGNTWTIYVNGVSGGTGNSSGTVPNNTSAFVVGAYSSDGNATYLFPAGYISNVRVVKGTAITPPAGGPTAPLQAVTNTSLLTLQTRAPATNNGFIDSSPNNFVVTRNGNTTQGSFSPFSPTGWSVLNSATSCLAAGSASDWTFLTNTTALWTFEMWVYPTVSGTNMILIDNNDFNSANVGINCYKNSSNQVQLNICRGVGGSLVVQFTSTGTLNINAWNNIVITYDQSLASQNLKFYLNGASAETANKTANAPSNSAAPGTLTIGRYRTVASDGVVGYLGSLRISNIVRTPSGVPTSAYTSDANTKLLICQYNRFLDGSANNYTLTVTNSPSIQAFSPFAPAQSYIPSQIGGSGYFPGSTSVWLVAPDNPALELGSNDFTIECWVYSTADFSATRTITAKWSHFVFGFNTTPAFYFAWYGTTNGSATGTLISTAPNAWHHLAVCRQGSTLYMFQNGQKLTQSNSTITGTLNNDNYGPLIGGNENVVGGVIASATEPWYGYISGYRIVNGTALYTSSFPIPTAPPTAIPNTSLLLNFTNGGIVDATGKNNLETVANSGVQTSQAKWSPGSMYFDGGGDWLVVPKTGNWSIGSSEPFTIEAWVYLTAAQANYRAILSDYNSGTPGSSKYLFINSSGIEFQLGTTAGTIASCTQSFSQNQWYYIAITRNSSNVISMYVDGTSKTVSQATQSGGFLDVGSFFYVGRWGGATAYEWYGYIDDLRITKGIARTITASPTGPFPLG